MTKRNKDEEIEPKQIGNRRVCRRFRMIIYWKTANRIGLLWEGISMIDEAFINIRWYEIRINQHNMGY